VTGSHTLGINFSLEPNLPAVAEPSTFMLNLSFRPICRLKIMRHGLTVRSNGSEICRPNLNSGIVQHIQGQLVTKRSFIVAIDIHVSIATILDLGLRLSS
jgi:hypothetical protein